MHAAASLHKQLQSAEARAEAADKSAATLQQHMLTWQSRMKKKDAEVASLNAKVVWSLLGSVAIVSLHARPTQPCHTYCSSSPASIAAEHLCVACVSSPPPPPLSSTPFPPRARDDK